MATPEIPPSMKGFAPFVTKAKQMEKQDPVISYYCYVYIVQQALAKGLTKGVEGAYTGHIMDILEQRKMELADNEAVGDDVVGKVYVEQFGNKIFGNAENTQNARRCTKVTAETFMAASVFLEVLRVFGELDPEISKKITFAKYSAARILKALKADEDPNPPVEEVLEDEVPPMFTDVAPPKPYEVSPVSPVSPHPQPATVEDAVDEAESLERSMARISTADQSLHPSRMMTPSNAPGFPSPPENHLASNFSGRTETMSTAETFSTLSQPPSAGYFPPAPYPSHETSVAPHGLDLPSAPPAIPSASSIFPSTPQSLPSAPQNLPSTPSLPPNSPPAPPDNFYSGGGGTGVGVGLPSQPEPGVPPSGPHWLGQVSPPIVPPSVGAQAPTNQPYYYSSPPVANPHIPPPPPQQQQYIQPQAYQRPQPRVQLVDPDENPAAIKEAHKCIRWADSALNFDDVPTAVSQLRLALKALGAE
ncbi:hypothetical protein TWF970_004026 [Orbilia oligospora]|uniref:DUF605-domain-containing protein n=1 Tax=Orbilia oligospora TaxID=2813651 RepID=A0A7C8V6M7_ORBOL|nr:hypothetical protein TWF970_004026 [Orbilia oligospora]